MKNKGIYVEWVDSASLDAWATIKELEKILSTKSHPIKTLGWLIKETEDSILVAENWDEKTEATEESTYSCVIRIPKKMISKRKWVKL